MDADLPRQPLRIARIIHVAMLFSMVAFLALALLIPAQDDVEETRSGATDQQMLTTMTTALALFSAFVTVVAWVLPARLYNDDKLRTVMLSADPSLPVDQPPSAGAFAHTYSTVHPLHAGLLAMRVPMVIRLAMLESVAMDGLFLSFLAADPKYYFWFGGIAFAMMLVAGPRPQRVVEMYRRLEMESAWDRGSDQR